MVTLQLGAPLSEEELCPAELLAGQEAAYARDVERLQTHLSEFVTVSCPACEGTLDTAAFDKSGFQFRRCEACRTIYMCPRPSEAVMVDYYENSENYAYWAKHIFPSSEASRREKIHRPWLNRILHYCDRHAVRCGTLVEAGPGFGTFCKVAIQSNKFDRVVAVEPTPELADACRQRGVDVIEKRIENVGEELSNVDILVAFEVIEHLFEPRKFVSQAEKLLNKGGLLVLSCPNGEGFDIATLGPQALAVDAEHVNLFNPASLSALVAGTGFEVLEVTTPGRLDAEFVREAALGGKIDLSHQPLLQRILIDEWDELGWPFQQFLAQNSLSSHMWLAARKF